MSSSRSVSIIKRRCHLCQTCRSWGTAQHERLLGWKSIFSTLHCIAVAQCLGFSSCGLIKHTKPPLKVNDFFVLESDPSLLGCSELQMPISVTSDFSMSLLSLLAPRVCGSDWTRICSVSSGVLNADPKFTLFKMFARNLTSSCSFPVNLARTKMRSSSIAAGLLTERNAPEGSSTSVPHARA
jgi:hypothetical protein